MLDTWVHKKQTGDIPDKKNRTRIMFLFRLSNIRNIATIIAPVSLRRFLIDTLRKHPRGKDDFCQGRNRSRVNNVLYLTI